MSDKKLVQLLFDESFPKSRTSFNGYLKRGRFSDWLRSRRRRRCVRVCDELQLQLQLTARYAIVQGDNCFFFATGVTDGELLQGVRFTPGRVHTQSLVTRSRSGTVRLIDAQHRLDKISEFSAIDCS